MERIVYEEQGRVPEEYYGAPYKYKYCFDIDGPSHVRDVAHDPQNA